VVALRRQRGINAKVFLQFMAEPSQLKSAPSSHIPEYRLILRAFSASVR